ncbi:MAG: hypothetical protein JNK15_16270 [Planctomycetes bacterium]|nr:hypothetical protein [Planctomycetota bacterium]
MNATPSLRRLTFTLMPFVLPMLAAGQTPARLAEWPPIKDTDKQRVLALAGQFRKDEPRLHDEAKKSLLQLGDGAAPLLLQQVSDKECRANELLFEVFDSILGPQHGALLAREVKKDKPELRRYLVRRMCCFHDADLAGALQALVKDKDELTSFYAWLGLLALKKKEAVLPVLEYSKTHWKDVVDLVQQALTPARSLEAGELVFEAIGKAKVPDQMAGLRLARYLMVKEQGVILRTYLDAAEHTVKREAVNAARVLNGEAPIENLDVFKAIEMAKQWRAKV